MAVSSQPLTTNQIGTSPFFQRLRRRLRTVGSVPSEHSNQNKAWRILYLLRSKFRGIWGYFMASGGNHVCFFDMMPFCSMLFFKRRRRLQYYSHLFECIRCIFLDEKKSVKDQEKHFCSFKRPDRVICNFS